VVRKSVIEAHDADASRRSQDVHMPRSDDDHNIDLPASPFTIVRIREGVVHTFQGALSFKEADDLMVAKVSLFDWTALADRSIPESAPLDEAYEVMLDVVSLVAELDLERARTLWSLHAPRAVGMPRMLAAAHDAQERRFLANLAVQRDLNDDALVGHILEEGEFMSDWAVARRQLISP
jgi:hypothetical protein